MIRRQPKTIQKSPKKKHLEFREDPVDLVAQDEERRRRFEQLKEQFRPSMVRLLHSELEKLGLGMNQVIKMNVYVRPALKCPSNLQSLLKADIISVIFLLMYNLKDGLTDNMFKIKMEQLRNNRASKIASRKAFTLSYICNIILTVKVRKML